MRSGAWAAPAPSGPVPCRDADQLARPPHRQLARLHSGLAGLRAMSATSSPAPSSSCCTGGPSAADDGGPELARASAFLERFFPGRAAAVTARASAAAAALALADLRDCRGLSVAEDSSAARLHPRATHRTNRPSPGRRHANRANPEPDPRMGADHSQIRPPGTPSPSRTRGPPAAGELDTGQAPREGQQPGPTDGGSQQPSPRSQNEQNGLSLRPEIAWTDRGACSQAPRGDPPPHRSVDRGNHRRAGHALPHR